MMSGTLAWNKWHAFRGQLSLPRGHPFGDAVTFLHAFSDWSDKKFRLHEPPVAFRNRLIRTLQAVTLRRPTSIIPRTSLGRVSYMIRFDEDRVTAHVIRQWTEEYKSATSRFGTGELGTVPGSKEAIDKAFGGVVRAMLMSLLLLLLLPLQEGISIER